ncbi:MAG: NAD(P)H-hydrate dehydratase [Candidatus Thorarchaeota archaeon]|nr:MAG: NAD(P)H-hydrate dehydratase [Candidatus Thorarchaeota archaeon]
MQKSPLTTEEMRIVELNANMLGITHSMLMQNAGREVARVVARNERVEGKRVVVLCGLGGNGGDGFVAARYLQEDGAEVEVYLLGSENDITNRDASLNWDILKNLHEIKREVLKTESSVKACKAILEADILIDAMMGFGLKNRVREPLLTAVKAFNKSEAKKYSVDVPTGIDSDTGAVLGTAVRADVTVALHAPKKGLKSAREQVGKLVVVSIGIPKEATRICGPGDLSLYTGPRRAAANKGDFGRILVVGGSNVYSGAPALTGMAALRTGADLVSVLVPESVVNAVRSYSPNLMVASLRTEILLQENVDTVLEESKNQDVVALGPGLGIDSETVSAVRTMSEKLGRSGKRMVIDADGLKALAGSEIRFTSENAVLTPHWGELTILLEEKPDESPELQDRIEASLRASVKYDSVILLKGPVDVVARPDGFYKLNRSGVPAMTVGGTGDVLTGIVATLLAQGKGAFFAATAGAYVSGRAGELAFKNLGDHITPTDCIDRIPEAMRQ